MDLTRPTPLNEQITEEAASWLVEFRSGELDSAARAAFDAWLRASPEHLRAYLEIATIWNEAQSVDAAHRIDVEQLLSESHGRDQIVALARPGAAAAPPPFERRPSAPHARRRALMAVAAAILLGAALLVWAPWRGSGSYQTSTGERRALRLADGTRVTLDARSHLQVNFTSRSRSVELLEGQALFEIAKDETRPFAVISGGTLVRDVGTQFDVNRTPKGTTVTVLTGRVAVYAQNAPAEAAAHEAPILVAAGEQLQLISGAGRAQPVPVDSGSATAWRKGQIVLNASTLADVVEEFNRYSPRQLVAVDEGATPLRLSGVFGIDPQFLIEYLRDRPDITVREGASTIEIIRSAAR